MALCTRCGQQTEGEAEFCPGCGGYGGSRESGADGRGRGRRRGRTGSAHPSAAARPATAWQPAHAPGRYAPPTAIGRRRLRTSTSSRTATRYRRGAAPGDRGRRLPPDRPAAERAATADPDPREPRTPVVARRELRGEQPRQHADDERRPFGPQAASPAPRPPTLSRAAQQTAEPHPGPPSRPPTPRPAPTHRRLPARAAGEIPAEPRPGSPRRPARSPDHERPARSRPGPNAHPGRTTRPAAPEHAPPTTPRRRTTTHA